MSGQSEIAADLIFTKRPPFIGEIMPGPCYLCNKVGTVVFEVSYTDSDSAECMYACDNDVARVAACAEAKEPKSERVIRFRDFKYNTDFIPWNRSLIEGR